MLRFFPAFRRALRQRLEQERERYAKSLPRPLDALHAQIEIDVLDLAGACFVAWSRLQALRARAELQARAAGVTAGGAPNDATALPELDAENEALLDRIASALRCTRQEAIRFCILAGGERLFGSARRLAP